MKNGDLRLARDRHLELVKPVADLVQAELSDPIDRWLSLLHYGTSSTVPSQRSSDVWEEQTLPCRILDLALFPLSEVPPGCTHGDNK